MVVIVSVNFQVMIFRLITRGTIEERMMQMTKKKMVLEHLVVGRLKAQNINQVCILDLGLSMINFSCSVESVLIAPPEWKKNI